MDTQNKHNQVFKAVTKYAGKLKTLFEIIFLNTTTANWTIDKNGMFLEETTNQNLLLNVFLPAECFDEYFFQGEQIYVGLGNHINKEFFKGVKNKDIITMSINQPFTFNLEKTNGDISQSLSVSTQDIQVITPFVFPEYKTIFVDLMGDNYNQLCRSFTASTMDVTKSNGNVEFSFSTGRSVKKLKCGKENKLDTTLIHRSFYTEQFSRLAKIHSFACSPIKIYYEIDKPLCFVCQSSIGCLKILIYEKTEE